MLAKRAWIVVAVAVVVWTGRLFGLGLGGGLGTGAVVCVVGFVGIGLMLRRYGAGQSSSC